MTRVRRTLAGLVIIAGSSFLTLAQDQFAAMKDSCAACHGEDAAGDVPHRRTRHGRDRHPLSDEEIATLSHYLARLNQDAACDAKGATRQ